MRMKEVAREVTRKRLNGLRGDMQGKGLVTEVVWEADRLLQQAHEAAQGPGFMLLSRLVMLYDGNWGIRSPFGAGHRRFDEIKTKPTWPAWLAKTLPAGLRFVIKHFAPPPWVEWSLCQGCCGRRDR